MLLNRREDEISDYHTPWGESHPVYDIEPDAQVEIKVTAQDGVTDSVYRVVVYSRPVEQTNQGSGEKLDSVSTGIPHFGDLWLQDADDNYYKTDFDTTYQMSKGGVHKLNLKASVPAGVNLFVGYTWRVDSVSNGSDSIWTVYSNGSVQAYPAGDTAFIVRLLNNKDGLLKTYNIALKHPDYSLSRFVLSKDAAGSTPMESDSEGRYTVEFDVDSVYLSFAANDTSFNSGNFDVAALGKVGRKIEVKDAKEYEHKYKLGLEEAGLSRTFLFTVQDGNNSKKYTAVVKRTIDFSLKNFSLKIGDKTVDVDPKKLEAVKVPATVNFVDIEVEADPVSDLVTAVKSVVGTDGSYVARVRLYVKAVRMKAKRNIRLAC
ncbi:MAG: hypothetical protein LBG45_03880 [Dysgonamonadaceae bacterium]|nr:hypothetical protein [Dysgonamonadaceae bacterium]